MVAVSALEVALISAIAAAAAVVVTPLAALITARWGHRHEYRLRLYEDRRDAYMALLRYNFENASWLDALLEAFEEDSDEKLQAPLNPSPAEFAAIQARVEAFASDEILGDSGTFQEDLWKAIGVIEKWRVHQISRHDAIHDLREAQTAAGPHLESLRRLIRDELARDK
jgi:hypothetical protein